MSNIPIYERPEFDRAIFREYLSGSTHAAISNRHGIPTTTVFMIIHRVGGKDARYTQIAKENREKKLQEIVEKTALLAGIAFDLRPGQIWRTSRKSPIVRARQASWLVASEHDVPHAAIGRAFEMNHTSVLHGCEVARNMMARDDRYARLVGNVRDRMAEAADVARADMTVPKRRATHCFRVLDKPPTVKARNDFRDGEQPDQWLAGTDNIIAGSARLAAALRAAA